MKKMTPNIDINLSTLVMRSISQGTEVPSKIAISVAHSGDKITRILATQAIPQIFKLLFTLPPS